MMSEKSTENLSAEAEREPSIDENTSQNASESVNDTCSLPPSITHMETGYTGEITEEEEHGYCGMAKDWNILWKNCSLNLQSSKTKGEVPERVL